MEQQNNMPVQAPLFSFDITKDRPWESLGISEERDNEISEQIQALADRFNKMVEDEESTGWCMADAWEGLAKIPKTAAEAFYIGALGISFFDQARNPLAALFSGL